MIETKMLSNDRRKYVCGMVNDLIEYYTRLKSNDPFEKKFAEKYEISFNNRIRAFRSARTGGGRVK